jgi:tRNA threonylcarbamoyladenosine biosynthesis protein TsaB
MRILALDTTTDVGGAAVGTDGLLEAAVLLRTPRTYSETLLPAVEAVLSQIGRDLGQIDLLAVTTGPGSFTGVRIGLAVAKAMGQSRSLPGLGVSTLEALARSFADSPRPVAPMLDARREQVYVALYSEGTDRLSAGERVVDVASWLKDLPPGLDPLFVGTGAFSYRSQIQESGRGQWLFAEQPPLLATLIRLATERADQAGPVESIRANYVRPSDAEMGRQRG